MDFTYLVGGLLSILIGCVSAIGFLALHGKSVPRLFIWAVAASVMADFALLIDWTRTAQITASFLLNDLAFFVVYAAVGCTIGIVPVLAAMRLYRLLKSQDYL